jgi:hypothetical protein
MQYLCSQCRLPVTTGMSLCGCGQFFSRPVPEFDPNGNSMFWPPLEDTRPEIIKWWDDLSNGVKYSAAGVSALVMCVIAILSPVHHYRSLQARYAPGTPVIAAGVATADHIAPAVNDSTSQQVTTVDLGTVEPPGEQDALTALSVQGVGQDSYLLFWDHLYQDGLTQEEIPRFISYFANLSEQCSQNVAGIFPVANFAAGMNLDTNLDRTEAPLNIIGKYEAKMPGLGLWQTALVNCQGKPFMANLEGQLTALRSTSANPDTVDAEQAPLRQAIMGLTTPFTPAMQDFHRRILNTRIERQHELAQEGFPTYRLTPSQDNIAFADRH